MALIDQLKDDLYQDEGGREFLYDDANGGIITSGSLVCGNPTVGVGRALNKNPLTKLEIDFLLDNDCKRVLDWCQKAFGFWNDLNQTQQRGLANMAFQLGEGGLLEFHDMIECLAKKDYTGARVAGLQSKWARQTPHRAEKVLAQIANG